MRLSVRIWKGIDATTKTEQDNEENRSEIEHGFCRIVVFPKGLGHAVAHKTMFQPPHCLICPNNSWKEITEESGKSVYNR